MANAPNGQVFRTADENTCLVLLSFGCELVQIDSDDPEDPRRMVLAFDREKVKSTLEAWISNKPLPHQDIRQVILAKELYNSYLRFWRERIRR